MKKVISAVAMTLVLSGAAYAAADAHRNTGCGLGTLLWENRADNSILLQAFQATTNGTSGSQTFGISSGTSNCQQPSKFVSSDKLINFVQANMDNLAKDIAMGKGETLDTYGELLGVAPNQSVAFNSKLQNNFGRIFTSEHVVVAEVIDNTLTVINN